MVSYFCTIQCDGPDRAEHFRDFPRRHRLEYEDNGLLRWKGSDKDILGFYQTWLYFGVMAEFFGHPIDTKDFVQGGDPRGT